MSASEHERAGGLVFWERIFRHHRAEAEDDDARPLADEAEELRLAWSRYCEVIAELEQSER